MGRNAAVVKALPALGPWLVGRHPMDREQAGERGQQRRFSMEDNGYGAIGD